MALVEVAVHELEDDTYAFTGAEGAPIRAGSFRARFWKPATERAGVSGLRMHDLRRSAVSLWIAHGASAKRVQVWAGHRSVATVFDRYGHLCPGGEDLVMDALDQSAWRQVTQTPSTAGPEQDVPAATPPCSP